MYHELARSSKLPPGCDIQTGEEVRYADMVCPMYQKITWKIQNNTEWENIKVIFQGVHTFLVYLYISKIPFNN